MNPTQKCEDILNLALFLGTPPLYRNLLIENHRIGRNNRIIKNGSRILRTRE
jgi:hypothetical protein